MEADNDTQATTGDEPQTEFERLLATASMHEALVTVIMRGPRTPGRKHEPGRPAWAALVRIGDNHPILGLGESVSEAIEDAAAGQVLIGPYAVKS